MGVDSRKSSFSSIFLLALIGSSSRWLFEADREQLETLLTDAATTMVAEIESKGHNSDPSAADVRRGINQAHGHLSEVNLGYVAAPIQSFTDQARSLARDLNIGVIGVEIHT